MHLFRLNDSLTNNCQFDEKIYDNELRLIVVGILGSSISIISVIENIILFYVFSTSKKLRRQNYANPVLLSLFDTLVSIGYFFTVPAHFFAYRFHSVELAIIWAKYMRYAYTLQHFALTVSNFLLVVASLERYLANGPLYSQKRVLIFMVRSKIFVILVIILLSILFKATIYFENTVLFFPNCAPILQYVPIWNTPDFYAKVRFWLRKIFTIILPFFVLVYCNFYIVMHLRKRRRSYKTKCFNEQSSEKKNVYSTYNTNYTKKNGQHSYRDGKRQHYELQQQQREQETMDNNFISVYNQYNDNYWAISIENVPKAASPLPLLSSPSHQSSQAPLSPNIQANDDKQGMRIATRTLVMVVGCYLISNSMTTIIDIWEFLDPKFLRYEHFQAYFFASDLGVLLTICGCALRLPIYVINDRRICNAIFRALIRFRYCHMRNGLQNFAADNLDFEKWSIVIVSNSLRSNITGMLSQVDFATFKGKKSFDQLAVLVQNRRRFLVQMTINLGTVEELPEEKDIAKIYEDDESTLMTNLNEEEDDYSISNSSILASEQKKLLKWHRSSISKQNYLETIVEPKDGNA